MLMDSITKPAST